MSACVVLAVDGGNSKTDLALLRDDGAVLALVRGRHQLAAPPRARRLRRAARASCYARRAAPQAGSRRHAGDAVGRLLLAGARPARPRSARCTTAVDAHGWARAARGRQRHVRRPARRHRARLGRRRGVRRRHQLRRRRRPTGATCASPRSALISGDWGGGYDVGLAALAAAARSEDGRGAAHAARARGARALRPRARRASSPRRSTSARVPQRRDRRAAAAWCSTRRRPTRWRPRSSIAWPDEVSRSRDVAIDRLDLLGEPVEVLLGGGMFRRADARCSARSHRAARLGDGDRGARSRPPPPIVGAALLGLDELGAGPRGPRARARANCAGGEEAVHG